MRLLIIGPPGSGKGTQALRLSTHLGIPAISTGEMFRSHLSGRTLLGLKAKKYLDAGDFVPDKVTNALVLDRLQQQDVAEGFLLDGYPRTAAQVTALDGALQSANCILDAALELAVEDDEIVRRLTLRAHTEGRSDDTEGTVRHRLQLYRNETAAVIEDYASRGILIRIKGTGDVTSVTANALASLTSRMGTSSAKA